ncbi:unnamed protein product [Bursaphelenchus xylophilus]|uniref:(pine wood nematode) hypothetical protein n=1 Tax=Bursaphelenchus xylophilus TaxID=6326 RepID=A0A1I7S0X3_BURXY|nr:unnamed protein product [Bursaphelenchus xylophilus]CAG9087838.1 unnamed protein product [Bursaphelenchus xylophilus]
MSDNKANSQRPSYWQAPSGLPQGPVQVPTGFYGDYNPNINTMGVSGSHYGANDSRPVMSMAPVSGISQPLMPAKQEAFQSMPMRPQPYPPLNQPSSYVHSTSQYYPPSQYRGQVPDYGLRDLSYGVHESVHHSPLGQPGYLPSTPQYYTSTQYRNQMADSVYGLRHLNYPESEPPLQNLAPLSSYAHPSHHYPSNFGRQHQDLDQCQRSAGNEPLSAANGLVHNSRAMPVSLHASNPPVSLQTPALKAIKKELPEAPRQKRKYTKRKNVDKSADPNPEPKVPKKRGRKKKEVDPNADPKGKKQSLYKVSLSRKRRENMAYPKNSFLLRYSDLSEEDHDFIWLVDNHQLLAKFVPNQSKTCTTSKESDQTETIRYYTRTDRYTGWFSNEYWNYIDFTDRVTVDGLSEISVRFPNRQEIEEMREKLLKRRDEEEKQKAEKEEETAEKKVKLEQDESNDGNGNEYSLIDVDDQTNVGFARSEGSNEGIKEGFDESTNDGVDEYVFSNEVGNGRGNLANIKYELENGEDHQEEWEENDDSNDEIEGNEEENERIENREEDSDDEDSNQENEQSDGDEEEQRDEDQNEQYEEEEDSEDSE